MAAPVNTVLTTNNPGQREDLEDIIYLVAPEETPFTSNIGNRKATARLHEWQTRDLAAANPNNAAPEGDDITAVDAPNLTTRVGVYAQIFRKTGSVSGTTEAVDLAGRDSELDEQKLIKGKEIRRDKEARYLGNFASTDEAAGPPATQRTTAGAQAWAESVTNRGSGGADGGWTSGGLVSAATDGTTRAFSETQVKDVLATGFSEGMRYTQAYMGPTHKQQFSAFAGIAEIRVQGPKRGQANIVAAADVYQSDFGDITLIPHAYALGRACVLINPDYLADGRLRRMQTQALAKTGDNERFLMTEESCLIVENEKGVAVIADLT